MQREKDFLRNQKLRESIELDNIAVFMDTYTKDDDNMIILAGGKDISQNLSQQEKIVLSEYGLSKCVNIGYGEPYVAIIEGSDVKTEISKENEEAITIERLGMYIKSAGAYAGSACSIKLNGVEYSTTSNGLSIVVYNRAENRVIDRVSY